MEEVINFLKNIKLEKYSDNFEEKGYDDFDFIKNMTQAQLTDMLEAVGMYEKAGHREKFLATLSILKSKNQNCEQVESNQSSVENKQLTEVWPESVQKLWIPNPLTEKILYENSVLSELYEEIYNLVPSNQFQNYVLSQRCTRR